MEIQPTLPKVLVVDDDERILTQVRWALAGDYTVLTATDRPSALKIFSSEDIPVVLLDLGLPPHPREATEGLRALEEFIAHNPLVKVVIVSGNADRQNAIRAVERGAHDIFPKPIEMDELIVVLKRVFKRVELEKESLEERKLAQGAGLEGIVGSSDAMRSVFSMIRKVADSDVPVLILGESGTGKELIANAIHKLSQRKRGPFVPINCSAIPETLIESELFGHEKGSFTGAAAQRRGKIEYAQNGTLLLDEIGDLAPELQVKILRFLQEKVIERVGGRTSIPVDVRVIAATNQDLTAAVESSRFREDLYFRLAVVKVTLPPLRDRGSDVIQLAEHFLAAYCKEMRKPPARFSRPALDSIRQHEWPGNVRELQNRVKSALVLCEGGVIGPEELELQPVAPVNLKEARQVLEKDMVADALRENAGNMSKTAKALGISRPTLYQFLDRYNLRP